MKPHDYAFVEFPCWKYHPDGESKLVHDEDELAALLKEDSRWTDSPANIGKPSATGQPKAGEQAGGQLDELGRLREFLVKNHGDQNPPLNPVDQAIQVMTRQGQELAELKGSRPGGTSTVPSSTAEPPNQDEAEQAAENDHPFTVKQVARMGKVKLIGLARDFYKFDDLPADEAGIKVEPLKKRIIALIEHDSAGGNEQE